MTPEAVRFPKDEGIHPHAMEWWYWNGHLRDERGNAYAFMFALFKLKLLGFGPFWCTHSLVTSVADEAFEPRIDLLPKGLDAGSFAKGSVRARARGVFSMRKVRPGVYDLRNPQVSLRLIARKPFMRIGGSGLVNLKSSSTYYYSIPRLECRGTIVVGSRKVRVFGIAWMDHQWNPVPVNREQAWKWFSLQLDDGTDLSCFEYGRKRRTRAATMSAPDGTQAVARDVRFATAGPSWESPKTRAKYPLRWRIRIPSFGLDAELTPLVPTQEMLFGPLNYWEGPLVVRGTLRGRRISGRAFLELVGVKKGTSVIQTLFQIIRETARTHVHASRSFDRWMERVRSKLNLEEGG